MWPKIQPFEPIRPIRIWQTFYLWLICKRIGIDYWIRWFCLRTNRAGSCLFFTRIFTAYLAEPCSRKIHRSIENRENHRHALQHNHTRNCHGFPLQMTGILKLLDNPLARLYAKCTLYLANTPMDNLGIRVDFRFPALNRRHKQLLKWNIYIFIYM